MTMINNTGLNGNVENGNIGTPIPGVSGWTYEAAASESKAIDRENRLFGSRNSSRRNRRSRSTLRPEVGTLFSNPDRFTAETGWTPEDAIEMALEAQRDRRIFGNEDSDLEFVDLKKVESAGDDFYVIDETGAIDKLATRERRLFGKQRWN
ncbi:MAG: hypothetical protein IAF58_17750 [Leptolyngbya sp.]|nr:hypothetical protein [Candidatus Melainabacteria bacterium]